MKENRVGETQREDKPKKKGNANTCGRAGGRVNM